MARIFESSVFVHGGEAGTEGLEGHYKIVVTVPPAAEALAKRAMQGTGVTAASLGLLEVQDGSSKREGGAYLLSATGYEGGDLDKATKNLAGVIAMATALFRTNPSPEYLQGLDKGMEILVPGVTKLDPQLQL